MKNRGTAALLVVLIVCSAITIIVTLDANTLFSPPVPKQIYEPTVPASNERVVCLVLDDGWKSHVKAADILETCNFTATFPIITSYVGYPDYMDWADIAQIAQSGNDIVSHTQTHLNLSAVDEAALHSELAESRQTLRSKGYAADVLVYPYGEGVNNMSVREAAAQHYLLARGAEIGKCGVTSTDRYNVNSYGIYRSTSLTDFASYLNGTQGHVITLLEYHKISSEDADNAVSKEAFQTQMQYLKENGFTVKTISQEFLKQTS